MSGRVTFADLLKKAEEKKKLVKPHDEKIKGNTLPTPPTPPTLVTPGTTPTSPTPPTIAKSPISPERDFAKVANSIVRDAVPQGLFIGKSKQIYDYLYLQTRGAIQPKRSVRITKSNLMRGADIGSERTLLKNLAHLKQVSLLKITEFDGQHGGNEYEVFLPEETKATPPTPPTPHQSLHAPQKVGTLPPVESGVGGVAQLSENKDVTTSLRLNTKTNTNDDDKALEIFAEKLNKVSLKLTGKRLNPRETEKWGILADLLILELEIAARRTENISSVPAFLTEVLRRQFFASRQQQQSVSNKSTKAKKDTVGKPETETYEIKPLDEQGREEALLQLREFAADDFLEDFKKWYTEVDWKWLKAKLAESEKS